MVDFTSVIGNDARVSDLQKELAETKRLLVLAETEARVWQGRYEMAKMKLDAIRGLTE